MLLRINGSGHLEDLFVRILLVSYVGHYSSLSKFVFKLVDASKHLPGLPLYFLHSGFSELLGLFVSEL